MPCGLVETQQLPTVRKNVRDDAMCTVECEERQWFSYYRLESRRCLRAVEHEDEPEEGARLAAVRWKRSSHAEAGKERSVYALSSRSERPVDGTHCCRKPLG